MKTVSDYVVNTIKSDREKLYKLQEEAGILPPRAPERKKRKSLMAKISMRMNDNVEGDSDEEELETCKSDSVDVIEFEDREKGTKRKVPALIARSEDVCQTYEIRSVDTKEIMEHKNKSMARQLKYFARRLLATQRRNMALTSSLEMANRSLSFEKAGTHLFNGEDLGQMIKDVLSGKNKANGWVRMGDYYALYKEYNLLVREYESQCRKFYLKPKSFKKYI